MKKLLAFLVTMILVLTSVSGVWAEGAEEGKELTVAVTTPLTGNFFTSMWGNGTSDLDVRTLIHGYNLVEWDTANGLFKPDASVVSGKTKKREANGDVTYIIALYDDLYYSDGTKITAWDYAFSMLLTMAPELKELGASVRTPEYIAGYADYISGKTAELKGVRVISDNLMYITISSAYLPFFYELGLLDCVPYPISVIAPGVKIADDGKGVYLTNADGGDEAVFTADLLKQTVLDEATGFRTHPSVSSGPYVLTSYEDGTACFEINPKYKGNSEGKKPTIQKIKMISMGSDELAKALEDGTVTVLNKVSDVQAIADCLKLADEQETLTSAEYARSGLSFISFNTEKQPLDDAAVRQAIAYLADRDDVAQETVGEYGMRAPGYFGMGQWMYLVLSGKAEIPAQEADPEAWEELSLDEIEPYDPDPEKGAALLDEAGWNLNENGEAFEAGKDTLRYRKNGEELEPLSLTMAYGKGSAAGKALEGALVESLAKAGIELKVEAIDADALLNQYYRLAEGEYDMYFLATNFDVLYDPSLSFIETEDGKHVWKTSGLEDEELWKLAVDMRKTEPEDILGYCEKWLAFQKRFAEVLPALPMYSNMYYDFYPEALEGYKIAETVSWPQTIIGTSWGE